MPDYKAVNAINNGAQRRCWESAKISVAILPMCCGNVNWGIILNSDQIMQIEEQRARLYVPIPML